MASICKRCRHPRSEWNECGCAWRLRRQVGGRVVYTTLGPDRAVAERKAKKILVEPEETMPQAVREWLRSKERNSSVRPGSLVAWRTRGRQVSAYFEKDLVRHIRPEHLSQFAQALLDHGYAPATARGIYSSATSVLRHAVRRGIISVVPTPVAGTGIPATEPRTHDVSIEELEAIIRRMAAPWDKVGELALLTGLRQGELLAVRQEDIVDGVLRVSRSRNRRNEAGPTKTKAGTRLVPLSPRAQELLDELDLPLMDQPGVSHESARRALVDAWPNKPPGAGWHSLRAGHAELLDQAGVPLREVARRMGHGRDWAVTLGYSLRREVDGDAVDVDRARVKRSS